jgi:thiosulfate dehydrogenase [quinone] large subunit
MTTTAAHKPTHRFHLPQLHLGHSTTAVAEVPAARYVWAAARISLGWIFLWAFLDKAFGLGHDTTDKQAWINGGHPTQGFLKMGTKGPFAGFYHHLAGTTVVDWLFMLALAGIGAALIFGIGMRIAAAAGVLLLVMMWSAVLPPANNLFMDEHLIYTLLIVGLALTSAGDTLGMGHWWRNTRLVRSFPILK